MRTEAPLEAHQTHEHFAGYGSEHSIEPVADAAKRPRLGAQRPNTCTHGPATTERPDGLPKHYELRKDGVYYREDADNPDAEMKWLCSPIRVRALTRDRASTDCGRLVEFSDPDGRRHTWAAPARLFAGDGHALRSELFALGFHAATGHKPFQALMNLLVQWRPRGRAITSDRLGWADEGCTAFVLGDGRVIGDQAVVYQTEHVPPAAAEMKAASTIERWRETIAERCVGNPLLISGVSPAFTGPLVELLDLEGGGIHLRGASSRGKSTILRAAVSVWGSPRLLQTWRATSNGLEGVASASNASLLALDELGEVSGKDASEAAYMLANGVGKSRADKFGQARVSKRWRTAILSSGELSLADKMAEAGKRHAAGQSVRLIDIVADGHTYGAFNTIHDERDGASFADAMKRATAEAYGTAGPLFVEALASDQSGTIQRVREFIDQFEQSASAKFGLDGEGQTSRVVRRLGLVAAAGEIASGLGLTGWSRGTATDALLALLEGWLKTRGGSGPQEAKDAIQKVRAFISSHGSSRFETACGDPPIGSERRVFERAGWKDDGIYYLSTDAWSDIHQGADPTAAARHLNEAGYLETEGPKRLKKKVPQQFGMDRTRAYAVRAEILEADDAA